MPDVNPCAGNGNFEQVVLRIAFDPRVSPELRTASGDGVTMRISLAEDEPKVAEHVRLRFDP
jgi:hypothetical protein